MPYMQQMQTIAKSSQVTVYVTQAFRKDGVPVDGAIVPPASHSNHLVGHAIDMNLDTPIGWCNSNCLQGGYRSSKNDNISLIQFDFLHFDFFFKI